MPLRSDAPLPRLVSPAAVAAAAAIALAGCGAASSQSPATSTAAPIAHKTVLPGTGKPPVTIGDKNFTEQFVLGELYSQALSAEGFTVLLNRNIGPTEVTIQALESGRLTVYPEYLDTWNTAVAGYHRPFRTAYLAYQAAQRYALSQGLVLLDSTPFSDTDAIGVSFNYATENDLVTLTDLRKVADSLTIGAAPQFEQNPTGLPAAEKAYGFQPAAFTSLQIGSQYQALDQGTVQAADVNTTDGQLLTGDYRLLTDPSHVFGWGNVVPVVPARVLDAEGPAFASTINKVSALLTLSVMRQLNAAVDISHQDPGVVAREFLMAQGLIPATPAG
jgi:osmoprotectant transport system substrate-binding protein